MESVAAGVEMATTDGTGAESEEEEACHDREMATTDGTGAESKAEDACHDLLFGRKETAMMQVAEVYQGKKLAHTGAGASVDRLSLIND